MASTTSFASLNTDVLTEILLRLDGWAVVQLARASSWILRHSDWSTLVAKRLQSERMGEPALFTALDDPDCLQSDLGRSQNPARRYSRYHQSSMTQSSLVMKIPPASGLCDALHLPKDTKALTLSLQAEGDFHHDDGEQILLAGALPVLAEHFYHECTPMLLCQALDAFFGSELADGDITRWNERRDLGPSQAPDEWTPASVDDPREWAANPQLDEPWSQSRTKGEWVALTKDTTPKVFLSAAPEIPKLTLVHRFVRPIVHLHCNGRANDIMAKARKTCQGPLVTWPAIVKRAMQMNGHKITAKELTALRPAFSKAGWPSSGAHLEDAEIPEYSDFNEGFSGRVIPAPQDQPPESEAFPLEFKVEGSIRQQYDYDPFIHFDIALQVRAGPGTWSWTSILQRDGYQAAAAALGLGDNSNVRPGAVLLAILVLTLGPKDCVAAWTHMGCWNDPNGTNSAALLGSKQIVG
ncbi:hypothetical protein HDU90_008677 [Geranomyces variabilis]|nr:hypothetical protein HDU90_008677 [Geranomyces variabilis]